MQTEAFLQVYVAVTPKITIISKKRENELRNFYKWIHLYLERSDQHQKDHYKISKITALVKEQHSWKLNIKRIRIRYLLIRREKKKKTFSHILEHNKQLKRINTNTFQF